VPPPLVYDQLVRSMLPEALWADNARLLDMKINLPEGAQIPHVKPVDDFLDAQMAQLEQYIRSLPDYVPKDWAPLEDFFLSELDRT